MKYITKFILTLIVLTSALRVAAQQATNAASFYKHLSYTIKYPLTAVENETQGYSLITFKVLNAKVSDVAVRYILGDDCDAEVVKQVLSYKQFGNFKDGNYALKVKFLLQGLASDVIENSNANFPKGYNALDEIVVMGYVRQHKTEAQSNKLKGKISGFELKDVDLKLPPLIILNHREIAHADVQNIDPQTIAEVKVLKSGTATDIYGSKGQNGVVILTTKDPNNSVKILGYDSKSSSAQLQIKANSTTSLSKDEKEPLYVLNGVEISKQQLNEIDPTTISSIEVLKDTASTAIYGTAGLKGVIKITTKDAKEKSKN